MKILYVALFLLSSTLFAQLAPSLQNPYCQERGHIVGYPKKELPRIDSPGVVDYPDSTVVITYISNPWYYTCQRCHAKIYIEPETYTEVVWSRKQARLDSLWTNKAKADTNNIQN